MNIKNITGNGGWQQIPMPGSQLYSWTLQARTAADIRVRAANNPTAEFTIKSGTVMNGESRPASAGQLEVFAANGVVVEVIAGASIR